MDADTVWFQNPQILWDSPLFHSTGALFYRDRNFAHFSDVKDNFSFISFKKSAQLTYLRQSILSSLS
jgi:hypothetical protein